MEPLQLCAQQSALTDPTGFFVGKIFKAIGNFFGKVLSVVKSAFKAILNVPFVRSVIQIAACASLPVYGCAAAVGALAIAAGGSLGDAVTAMAYSTASWGIWSGVGFALGQVQTALGAAYDLVHAGVHGVVGGAISAARGGGFLDGFITSGLSAIGGSLAFASPLGAVPGNAGVMVRSSLAGAFGGLGARLTGDKFANGFLTGAFAHLWNQEMHRWGGTRRIPG